MDEMKLVQPNSNVQISKKNPDNFLEKACKIARKGWGQPAFYNTEAIVQELLNAGKTIDDARCGGASGCVETGAFGKEAYILTGYLNLSKILEITLYNGYDPYTDKNIGIKTGNPEEFKNFNEFLDAYKKQLNYFIEIKIKGNNIIENLYSRYMPVPFMSTVIDDCIHKGRDYNSGGARYNTNYIQGVGIGNDNDYADELMIEGFEMFYEAVTGRKNMKGGEYRINMLPTTCHIYFGSVTGATPNGRKAHEPLPDGISPSKNADKNGPTAVLKSVSKMDHLKTGGTLLNQKFNKDAIEGKKALKKFAGMIRAFFKMDAHHIQFNVIGKETLLKAQQNPEDYENLIVRVAGYSDYFNNLSKELQDEIIARTEQS